MDKDGLAENGGKGRRPVIRKGRGGVVGSYVRYFSASQLRAGGAYLISVAPFCLPSLPI